MSCVIYCINICDGRWSWSGVVAGCRGSRRSSPSLWGGSWARTWTRTSPRPWAPYTRRQISPPVNWQFTMDTGIVEKFFTKYLFVSLLQSTGYRALVCNHCSVVEPKLFIFGSNSTSVHNFGSSFCFCNLKQTTTVVPYRKKYRKKYVSIEVFFILASSKTDWVNIYWKDNSGSRSKIISPHCSVFLLIFLHFRLQGEEIHHEGRRGVPGGCWLCPRAGQHGEQRGKGGQQAGEAHALRPDEPLPTEEDHDLQQAHQGLHFLRQLQRSWSARYGNGLSWRTCTSPFILVLAVRFVDLDPSHKCSFVQLKKKKKKRYVHNVNVFRYFVSRKVIINLHLNIGGFSFYIFSFLMIRIYITVIRIRFSSLKKV